MAHRLTEDFGLVRIAYSAEKCHCRQSVPARTNRTALSAFASHHTYAIFHSRLYDDQRGRFPYLDITFPCLKLYSTSFSSHHFDAVYFPCNDGAHRGIYSRVIGRPYNELGLGWDRTTQCWQGTRTNAGVSNRTQEKVLLRWSPWEGRVTMYFYQQHISVGSLSRRT